MLELVLTTLRYRPVYTTLHYRLHFWPVDTTLRCRLVDTTLGYSFTFFWQQLFSAYLPKISSKPKLSYHWFHMIFFNVIFLYQINFWERFVNYFPNFKQVCSFDWIFRSQKLINNGTSRWFNIAIENIFKFHGED